MQRPLDLEALRTLGEDELLRTLDAVVPGLDTKTTRTIAEHPRETLASSVRGESTLGARAVASLRERNDHAVLAGLDLEETLGEGGMGVVRLATQRALGRRVAVKTLRAGPRNEDATLRLLREAWVTGALEHPNIVPVHDLGLDDTGAPVIVLKRIEGKTWEAHLAATERLDDGMLSAEALEEHLRVFVQVCRAVSLAHARGIVHRDLKPENVMIGEFGEVYLVDWGIAVSLRQDPSGRFPTLASTSSIAGTPCYMAPEMLLGGAIDERTDVYLLGALLHEILQGAPPHDGASFHAIARSILGSTPAISPKAPLDLADVARRAMARDAGDRFASADEVRARVERYLSRRGYLALEDAARVRLAELRRLAATGSRDDGDRVRRAFIEASFAFRQALAASAENDDAATGLRATVEEAVAWELARGTPEGAASALATLADPPADLVERVAAARAAAALEGARVAELAEVGRAFDPTTGARTRVVVFCGLAALWTVTLLLGPRLEPAIPSGTLGSCFASIVTFLVPSPLLWWGRRALARSMLNRRLVSGYILACAFQITLELANWLLRIPRYPSMVLHLFAWFTAAAAVATFVERRLFPAVLGYVVALVAAALHPTAVWQIASSANFFLLLNVVALWRSLAAATKADR